MKINCNSAFKGMLAMTLFLSIWGVSAHTLEATNNNSQLVFSGEHAGMTFSGIFERWQSTLVLPPAQSPSITATFDLSSAKTGDWTYDSTLPEADWFHTDAHPEGQFMSNNIKVTEEGFAVEGQLTLRGITQPVEFRLNTVETGGFTANMVIDRLEFDIGLESDPDAEWVSREILLSLTIE